jgi:dCTP deaminase
MDLHVDTQIIFERDTTAEEPFKPLDVDPYNQDNIDAMFTEPYDLPRSVPPQTRALLNTWEEIKIPLGKLGLIGLRSTWARLGFSSPLTIADPGFQGSLTIELNNTSLHRLRIRPGERIWSMTLVASDEPAYNGRYQRQRGIQLPKALLED